MSREVNIGSRPRLVPRMAHKAQVGLFCSLFFTGADMDPCSQTKAGWPSTPGITDRGLIGPPTPPDGATQECHGDARHENQWLWNLRRRWWVKRKGHHARAIYQVLGHEIFPALRSAETFDERLDHAV